MTISKGRQVDPPADSVPTYIRLTKTQLRRLDRVVRLGYYATRSEAVRTAVTRMFGAAYLRAEERKERRNAH
jgi:Arc/MetJ-type ribon-helix-helix transcriptional regulator